jgi:putative membrane protein
MENNTSEGKSTGKPPVSTAGAPSGSKKGIRKLMAGFLAAFGIGKSTTQIPKADTNDKGTLLAHKRTDLAMDRTYWAAQRTLMGWIRTSLSMISFGFTIGKLGQTLQVFEVKGLRGTKMIGIDTIAYFLVIIGTTALLGAAVQYSRRVHVLCEQGLDRQISIEFVVAIVLSVMGLVAFSSLVMNI